GLAALCNDDCTMGRERRRKFLSILSERLRVRDLRLADEIRWPGALSPHSLDVHQMEAACTADRADNGRYGNTYARHPSLLRFRGDGSAPIIIPLGRGFKTGTSTAAIPSWRPTPQADSAG